MAIYYRKRLAADPEGVLEKAREYMRNRRAEDPEGEREKGREYQRNRRAEDLEGARKKGREYMRMRRAEDPGRTFHDTYQTSLIGRLRGKRPSKLVDGLRKACTMPPATDDDIFDHLKAQTPPRAAKWMCIKTWGKGEGKCELDHMFPKRLESGIEGVTGYEYTLEDIFRE